MSIEEQSAEPGRSRGREIALNLGAIAGLICVLAAAASFLFGIKPLVFRSGSMSPDIPTGALALSKTTPATDLQVGDVVSVENESGVRITHRVHEIVSTDGATSTLILKGDANTDADISPYMVAEVDRVFFSVPGLGYAVSWLSSPAAIFLGGALVGGVMVLAFGPGSKRKNDDDSDPDGGDDTPGSPESADDRPSARSLTTPDTPTESFRTQGFSMRRIIPSRVMIALGLAGLTALGASSVGTTAAFTDSATAASAMASRSSFVPAPKYLGCTPPSSSGSVTIKWEHLGPGYTYEIKTPGGYYATRPQPTLPANKGDVISKTFDAYNDIYGTNKAVRVEIRSIRNGVTGSSFVGEELWTFTIWNMKCNGAISGGADQMSAAAAPMRLPLGDATTTVTATEPSSPTTPQPTSTTTSMTVTTSVPSTTQMTTTTSPSTTTTTRTTSPSATSSNDATSEPSAGAPSPTAVTTATAPKLTGATTSPSGTYIAGTSGRKAVVRDDAGEDLFTQRLSGDAEVQWDSTGDTLWIVDEGTLYRVEAGIWRAEVVDPESGTVPTRIGALVK
ncbi:signal peptidase I [Rhodococcus hoagii]|nr:signal peptidase I [Prescottella equi]